MTCDEFKRALGYEPRSALVALDRVAVLAREITEENARLRAENERLRAVANS